MKFTRFLFRPWSFQLFILSVPISYVVFVGFMFALSIGEVSSLSIARNGVIVFSVYWALGCYLFVPGCWAATSWIINRRRRL